MPVELMPTLGSALVAAAVALAIKLWDRRVESRREKELEAVGLDGLTLEARRLMDADEAEFRASVLQEYYAQREENRKLRERIEATERRLDAVREDLGSQLSRARQAMRRMEAELRRLREGLAAWEAWFRRIPAEIVGDLPDPPTISVDPDPPRNERTREDDD